MRIKLFRFIGTLSLLALCLPLLGATPRRDTVLRYTLSGKDCSFADYAEYGLWVPGGRKPLRGVIVLQHGCTMEMYGITRPYDLQYQAFARKWNLAVLETALHGDCGRWATPETGSAEALMRVLAKASEAVGRKELSSVPWLIWGHSGGGFWTLAMLRDYPERILAAVAYSAAWDPDWDYSPEAARVPLLLRHAGAGDFGGGLCAETAYHAFAKLRAADAPVSIVCNVGENHNYTRLRHMMLPFFESALRERRPGRGGRIGDVKRSHTWLGDTLTFEVFPEKGYSGDKAALCRFPDKASARAWSEYARTNEVLDRTSPPRPRGLTVRVEGDSLTVRWQAEADPESGISCFRVYWDGAQVARVPESGEYQTFDTNGDNTVPVVPPRMEVRLPVPVGKRVRVCIEQVNQAGLSSKAFVRVAGRR